MGALVGETEDMCLLRGQSVDQRWGKVCSEWPESNRTQTRPGEQRKALVTANPVKCRDYNSGLKKHFSILGQT